MPTYKGNYTETMTAAIAAFRAGEQPHIVQVFEVGTATMMAAEGAIYPVYQLMADAGIEWDPNAFLPAVVGYYTTPEGKMLSMPFNSSTPVLYYNKAAFEKAGLDPEQPPKTWDQLVEFAKKTQAAGYPCGFTTQWQGWIQVENMSAWHNQPLGTLENGFGGLDTELVINQNDIMPRHIANMAEWQKTKIFDYGGRRGDSDPKFFSGECAMFFASSAAYAARQGQRPGLRVRHRHAAVLRRRRGRAAELDHRRRHAVGAAGARRGGLPGRRRSSSSYLSSPEVQADWHQFTGYLPITEAAYELTKEQGFYEKNPGTRDRDQADHAQSADRELEGPALRQLRADPRHHRRGAGSGLERRQGRAAGARRHRRSAATSCCGGSRTPTAEVRRRGAEPVAARGVAPLGRTEPAVPGLAPGMRDAATGGGAPAGAARRARSASAGARFGSARARPRSRSGSSSSSAWLPYALRRAAARDHARLLHLAGEPGALAVAVHPGRVRAVHAASSASTTSPACSRIRATCTRSG